MQRTSASSIRILIVDDHPVMCSGLSNLLNGQAGMTVIGTCGSGSEAIKMVNIYSPDLLLLDVRMPGMDGIAVLQALQSFAVAPKVVVLTSYEQDELIYQAIRAGAQGYVLKDAAEADLIAAITVVHAGKRYIPLHIAAKLADRMMRADLTPREVQTLELLAKGLTNKQIGSTLHLSDYTIRHYVHSIMDKLAVSDRTEAVAMAFRSGLLSDVERNS
ncbi:response regulator transcription factor [Acidisarcina polymorpha]|nr:response regulator transcription factor [Acidisarcina polymorpha]